TLNTGCMQRIRHMNNFPLNRCNNLTFTRYNGYTFSHHFFTKYRIWHIFKRSLLPTHWGIYYFFILCFFEYVFKHILMLLNSIVILYYFFQCTYSLHNTDKNKRHDGFSRDFSLSLKTTMPDQVSNIRAILSFTNIITVIRSLVNM